MDINQNIKLDGFKKKKKISGLYTIIGMQPEQDNQSKKKLNKKKFNPIIQEEKKT